MRRAIVVGVGLVAAFLPAAGNAGSASCQGVAPVVDGCRMTFIASGGEMGSSVRLVMDGRVDVVATAPSGGRIEIHCQSQLVFGSETCESSLGGPFRPGETVTLVASASGIGYWEVGASA